MDLFQKALGEIIREMREDLELTQSELAADVGIEKVSTIRAWEQGRARPRKLSWKRLAKRLGRSSRELEIAAAHKMLQHEERRKASAPAKADAGMSVDGGRSVYGEQTDDDVEARELLHAFRIFVRTAKKGS